MLMFVTACDPALKIEVRNRTSETLTVWVTYEPGTSYEDLIGTVSPNALLKDELAVLPSQAEAVTVIARDNKGNTIYTHRFVYKDYSNGRLVATITPTPT